MIITFLFISAIEFPLVSFIIGMCHFVGRVLYGIGYSSGPQKRVIGALVGDLCILGSFGLAITSLCLLPGNTGPGFVILFLNFECLLIGFLVAGGLRSKVFNLDFMNQWEDEH